MTPPIGVVYAHRQERPSFAAELRLLLKVMRSQAFSDFLHFFFRRAVGR